MPRERGRASLSVDPQRFHGVDLRRSQLEGREFHQADREGGQRVVVVSRGLARTVWGDASPIGKQIRLVDRGPGPWLMIVGVAEEVRDLALDVTPGPRIYLPLRQSAASVGLTPYYMALMVSAQANPELLMSSMRHAIAAADAQMPIASMRPLTDYLEQTLTPHRRRRQRNRTFAMPGKSRAYDQNGRIQPWRPAIEELRSSRNGSVSRLLEWANAMRVVQQAGSSGQSPGDAAMALIRVADARTTCPCDPMTSTIR